MLSMRHAQECLSSTAPPAPEQGRPSNIFQAVLHDSQKRREAHEQRLADQIARIRAKGNEHGGA